MLKQIKLWSVSSMLLLGSVSPAYAEQTPTAIDVYYAPIQFVFDSEVYAPSADQQGFIYEGSTYVPLRFISYSLKKAVRWDANTYTVTVEEPKAADLTEINEYNLNTKVRKDIAKEKVDAANLKPTSISAYKEKVNYVFDGKNKEIGADLPGFIYQDSLYVPLRFFSESIGKKIEWDQATYTVAATTQEAPKQETPKEETKQPEPPKTETPPVTTPPVVGGGSGGGGGGSGSKNSASAQAKAEEKLKALESSCRNALQPLADQYADADTATKAQLLKQGAQKVADCERQFGNIISEARSQGVSEDILSSYRARFEQVQEEAKAELLKKFGK